MYIMYIYTYTYACNVYLHTYIHTYVRTYVYVRTYMHACMHACIHTYMHACMHVYIHIYIYININVYFDIHTYSVYTTVDAPPPKEAHASSSGRSSNHCLLFPPGPKNSNAPKALKLEFCSALPPCNEVPVGLRHAVLRPPSFLAAGGMGSVCNAILRKALWHVSNMHC